MSKALGKNPLLAPEPMEEEQVLTEKDIATIRAATSDADQFTTMSYKIRKTYAKKLRDYAYTERIAQKEALDQILGDFFDRIDDSEILECPDKPRQTRRRNFG